MLGETTQEVINFASRVTNTLCALFTILTLPQVNEIEKINSDEIGVNDVITEGLNTEKRAATIR